MKRISIARALVLMCIAMSSVVWAANDRYYTAFISPSNVAPGGLPTNFNLIVTNNILSGPSHFLRANHRDGANGVHHLRNSYGSGARNRSATVESYGQRQQNYRRERFHIRCLCHGWSERHDHGSRISSSDRLPRRLLCLGY